MATITSGGAPAPISDAAPAASAQGIAERLRLVHQILGDGTITSQQAAEKRAQILAELDPTKMSAREALLILKQLQSDGLITNAEFAAKQKQLLDSL